MTRIKTQCSALIIIMAALLVGACTGKDAAPEGMYLIEGMLKNVPDSTIIELRNTNFKLIAKDTLINGRFVFCDSIDGTDPQKLCLLSHGKGFPNSWLDVWLQARKRVVITGEDCLLPLWNVDSEVPEQQVANDFMALCPEERRSIMQLRAEATDLIYASRGRRPDMAKIDSLRKLYKPKMAAVFAAELDYMLQTPVTTVWLDKLAFHCLSLTIPSDSMYWDKIRSLYSKLSEADKQTEYGQEITEYMTMPAPVNEGDDMVDGDLYDLDGNVRHLSEFKGQYILLDFWGGGCSPCIRSIPELNEITEAYRDRLAVVSISMDHEESWKENVASMKLKGNQWNELRKGNGTGLAVAYQMHSIPHYVMISPEGKVLRIWHGYHEGSLKAKIEELIK